MSILRKIILKGLKFTAFDINIKHHFTKSKFRLNTYTHKGYWYYGSKREENTIKAFKQWIKPNDYVLEIGAHIGYFTTFFADLVGKGGKVDVFEPSDVNLKYLIQNIAFQDRELQNKISVVKKGAGDVNGTLDFYIDPITGQNNSFVENFEGFFANREGSAESNAVLTKVSADVITLDSYFEGKTQFPDFVKIDVEGFEWNVIQGFKHTIEKHHPSLMIEIQKDAEEIINYFKQIGYHVYNDAMQEINNHDEYLKINSPNIFFKKHSV